MSDLPELSSSKRKIQSVRLESVRNPNGLPNGSRDGYGMGRERGFQKQLGPSPAEKRSAATFAAAQRFAAEKLPDQPEMWTASCWLQERNRLKREPTVAEVMARLQAYGRANG